jgi:hypothetical protein
MPPNTPNQKPPATPAAMPKFLYQATHVPVLGLVGEVSCDMAAPKGYTPVDDERGAWMPLQFNESRRGYLVRRLLVKV